MSIEYYARCDYEYSGDSKFTIPFEYIDKSHVVIVINDDNENPSTNFNWLTDYQIDYQGELTDGDIISVRRTTPLDERFVVFTDGNILDEESQNLSALQVFDKMQEITDAQNSLLAKMTEFLTLKTLIEDTLNTLKGAYDVAEASQKLLTQTTDLVQDITDDYNNLSDLAKKGIRCSVAKNLFSLEITDKTLSGVEKEGLGEQGETIYASDYEKAYSTIVNEFNTGEKQVYTSTDEVVYYKSFTGAISGDFYLPYDKELEVGETVYSDTYCTDSLGEITYLENSEVDKYNYGEDTFYVNKGTELELNTVVYSDETLQTFLGVITGMKTILSTKYQGSRTGTFYIDANATFRVGRQVYSDDELRNQLGYITAITNFEADEYSVGGLDEYEKFYVPKGTVIAKNTVIYSDKYCTTPIGSVGTVGSASSGSGAYYYSHKYNFGNGVTGSSTIKFYTKEKMVNGKTYAMYKDSAFKTRWKANNNGMTYHAVSGSNSFITYKGYDNSYVIYSTGKYTLVSSAGGTTYAYITLGTDATKLSYNKLATVSSEVISINDGATESYEVVGNSENQFIKLNEDDYLKYTLMATLQNLVMIINEGIAETVIDNGILSHSGLAFEYVLAENGHKIADVKYKAIVETLNEFYILDMENENFILPILNPSRNIYFVVGNIVVAAASIQGVTKAYLDERLEDYLPVNSEVITAFTNVIASYQEDMQGINEALERILGE